MRSVLDANHGGCSVDSVCRSATSPWAETALIVCSMQRISDGRHPCDRPLAFCHCFLLCVAASTLSSYKACLGSGCCGCTRTARCSTAWSFASRRRVPSPTPRLVPLLHGVRGVWRLVSLLPWRASFESKGSTVGDSFWSQSVIGCSFRSTRSTYAHCGSSGSTVQVHRGLSTTQRLPTKAVLVIRRSHRAAGFNSSPPPHSFAPRVLDIRWAADSTRGHPVGIVTWILVRQDGKC